MNELNNSIGPTIIALAGCVTSIVVAWILYLQTTRIALIAQQDAKLAREEAVAARTEAIAAKTSTEKLSDDTQKLSDKMIEIKVNIDGRLSQLLSAKDDLLQAKTGEAHAIGKEEGRITEVERSKDVVAPVVATDGAMEDVTAAARIVVPKKDAQE